jgi:translocation and assembly module TamB
VRRSLKAVAWLAGGLTLLLVLVIGVALILGNTSAGRVQIEKLVARLTGGNVQLSGLAGAFPSHLTLEQLELKDAAGVWLTAKKIQLDWTPWAYLEGRLQIDQLHVASVDMERLPQSSSTTTSQGEVSIPRIDVAQASLNLVQLGATLAGAPTSLVANGSAHLRSVRDMLFDVSARRIDGDGQYELHLHFDAQRMDAALKLHEPASGPLENVLSLPGLGALEATLNLSGLRKAEQLQLSLQAGELKGQAQGNFNLDDLSADLAFSFESGAMSPRPDLAWERGMLRGRWRGSVRSPNAAGRLEIARLRVPGQLRAASLSADLAADGGKAELHTLIQGLQIPGSQPRLLESDPVKIDASVRLDDPARRVDLTASHRLFALKGQAVTAGEQSATLELRLPNLAPFAAYAAQDVRGSAVINARLAGYPAATRIKLDADAALMQGSQVWAGAVGDRARLEFSGVLKDDSLSMENAKLSGRAIALSASGTVGSAAIDARWELSLPDLSAVSAVLAGNLKAAGSLQGLMAALTADAKLSSTLSVRGTPSGELAAEVKVRGLPSAPNGTLAAKGTLDGAPLNLDVSMERSAERVLHALIHQATWKSAHAEGDLNLSTDKQQLHGQLTLSVGQLEDLQRLLGLEIAGSLAGNLRLQPDGQRTRAHLQVDAKDLTLSGLAGSVHLAGEGFTDSFAFKAGLELPKLNGVAASLGASGNFNLDVKEISISSASGSYGGQEIRLLEPARFNFADGIAVDLLKLGADKAELDVQGRLSPALALRASLRQVQPALVNVFVPNLLAAGVIEAHADLHGSVAAPMGEVTVNALGVQSADDAALGLPPANIRITAGLRGHTADIDARLDAGSVSQLTAQGQAPLAADGEVDMKINGRVDVGLMNAFLEARGQHASGQVEIDATVTGNVSAPQITGTLDLKNGKINDYGRGVSLTDIAAQIVGHEGTLQIKTFTAAAAPGTVTMNGSVGILQKGFPVDLQIAARNAQPLVSKLITSNLNADLTIKGTARERLDVAGSMHLNRTLIGIPNGLPLNVAVLDVRRRGTKKPVPEKPLVIGLNVAVQAPDEIRVQGRGLDARMRGDLQIGGTTDAPLVSGGFDLERGTFSLATGRLNFTEGRVSFNGAGLQNKIDPTLDFTAQTTIGDTTATMHITGLADAPVFDFSSSPAKPQDEIMALLLFGAPTQQLTPLQLAQVGAALASMSGVGGSNSLNPLVKIQKSLGLDRLSIGAGTTNAQTGQDSGASIEAGRYVSKRVYIEAKQSTAGTSQLEADVDLTKHLRLQTRLGNGTAVQGTTPDNDPGTSVGLIYRFEY